MFYTLLKFITAVNTDLDIYYCQLRGLQKIIFKVLGKIIIFIPSW